MVSDTDIGFAVVGLGMGANRARQVVATPGARLVAVCDLRTDRLGRVTAEHGCEGTTEYRELLDRADVDVIYVMTESGNHAKVGIDAARAGKHVITTKPIETTLEKADALISACTEEGVRLLVDFENRYQPVVNRVKAALVDGLFGEIILAEARLKWYRSDAYYDGWHGTWELDGGGSLINQAVHDVDMLCWFMGPPETVRGRIGVYGHDIETEDMAIAVLHYSGGAEGVIVCTTTFPDNQPAGVQVHGTQGGAIIAGGKLSYWKTVGDAVVAVPAHPTCAADDMVRTLCEGQPLACDGHEGRASLALVRAVYESAQRGEELVRFAGW